MADEVRRVCWHHAGRGILLWFPEGAIAIPQEGSKLTCTYGDCDEHGEIVLHAAGKEVLDVAGLEYRPPKPIADQTAAALAREKIRPPPPPRPPPVQ